MELMDRESRKRLQSESDSKKNQDKYVEELQVREEELQQQLSAMKTEKQRLEDTIYRLKKESMASTVMIKQMSKKAEDEKNANVSEVWLLMSLFTVSLLF